MSKPKWNANDIAVPIWVMGSGVPTEKTLEQMRTADSPVHYLVGTSKGRLTRLQKALLLEPWQEPRPDRLLRGPGSAHQGAAARSSRPRG